MSLGSVITWYIHSMFISNKDHDPHHICLDIIERNGYFPFCCVRQLYCIVRSIFYTNFSLASWAKEQGKVVAEEALWGRQGVPLGSERQQRRRDTSGKKYTRVESLCLYCFIPSKFEPRFLFSVNPLVGRRRRSSWRHWGSIMLRRLSITRKRLSACRGRLTVTRAKSES